MSHQVWLGVLAFIASFVFLFALMTGFGLPTGTIYDANGNRVRPAVVPDYRAASPSPIKDHFQKDLR
jgi:hypothetical protein